MRNDHGIRVFLGLRAERSQSTAVFKLSRGPRRLHRSGTSLCARGLPHRHEPRPSCLRVKEAVTRERRGSVGSGAAWGLWPSWTLVMVSVIF